MTEPAADDGLPDGLELTRTTAVFDESTVPAGLLRAHQVATRVWGRLVVREGETGFVFEDEPEVVRRLRAGESVVIPPERPHHVHLVGPVRFVVEFYRAPGQPTSSPSA